MTRSTQTEFYLEPESASRLANLSGQLDANIKQVSKHFHIRIFNRGHHFKMSGEVHAVDHAAQIIKRLYRETHNGTAIRSDLIHLLLQEADIDISHAGQYAEDSNHKPVILRTPKSRPGRGLLAAALKLKGRR